MSSRPKLREFEAEKNDLIRQKDQLAREIAELQSHTADLLNTQKDVLDFLGGVTNAQKKLVRIPSMISRVEKYIDALPAGKGS